MLFKTVPKPTAQDVASRALCLGLVSLRAELEQTIHAGANPAALDKCREIGGKLLGWAHGQGLWKKGSKQECRFLEIPFGQWTAKEIEAMLPRYEGAAALMWALNRFPLPALPTPAPREAVFERLRICEDSRDFVNFSALRSPSEIENAKQAAAVWHWRSMAQAWVRHPERARPGADIPGAIRAAAMTAVTKGYAPQPLEGDFPAFGKPYRELSDEEFARASHAARERHHAFNWITGQAEDWDEINTQTEGLFRV